MARVPIQVIPRDPSFPEFFDEAMCRVKSFAQLASRFPLVFRWRAETADRNWTDTQARTELFFPPKGDLKRLQAAKSVCAACPVRERCLDWALGNGDLYGVLGGLSESHRREEYRLRRKADPSLGRRPIAHGTSMGQYRRCSEENGSPCEWCRRFYSNQRVSKSA